VNKVSTVKVRQNRFLLAAMAAALVVAPEAMAQRGGRGGGPPAPPPPPPLPGLECFDHLEMPDFPASALKAHVDGTVWTWVQASPTGTVDKIDTQVVSAWSQAPQMLTPAVEKAVRASKIKSDCDGKKIAIVFRYQLEGQPTANPKVTTQTEKPNIVDIDSEPEAGAAASAKK